MLHRFLAAGALRVVAAMLVMLAWASPGAQTTPPVPRQALQWQSPAAQREAADRAFLRRRGIGPVLSHGQGTQPGVVQRVQAARLQAARSLRQGLPLAASATGRSLPASSSQSTTSWLAFGPLQLSTPAYGLVTGRISSLAADPNDTSGNTLYVGATGGGVWKSTNAAGNAGSATFTPLTDDIAAFANSAQSVPSLSIGAITVQPGNPQVILAGTGDPNDALDSYYGVGLLRSANGGQSWTLIQQSRDGNTSGINYSMVGLGFAGFAWSSTSPNLVVAAVSQSLEGLLVDPGFSGTAEAGLYYSTDAGQTWYLSTITDGTNEIIQSSNPPSGSPGNPVTAVVWNPVRQLFIAAVRFHGYYSSSDGVTWTRLAQQPGANLSAAQCPANPGGVGNSSCPIFRGALAVQPVTGDTFALTTDLNNVDQGIYQDVCSTSGLAATSCGSSTVSFGTQIPDTSLDASDGTIPQADYNLSLAAVSSQQDTLLFAGTEDIFRCSLANSCTWRNTTNDQTCAAAQVAPSTHAIEGRLGANGLLYFGNDGGLWRTTDGVAQTGSVCASTDASHYQNLNGGLGSLAEIGHLAVSAATGSNGTLVLAGMGGFGVVASESAAAQGGTGAWQQLLTGEGTYVAIDPQTPSNWYADGGPGLAIYSCANGGNCNAAGFGVQAVIGRSQIEDDADYLLDPAPWVLDPADPTSFLVATCRVWRGPVTGGWSANNLLSTMLDGNQGSFCDGNAALRSLGAGGSYNGSAGGEQMYAGMAGPLDGGGSVPGHLYGAIVPHAAGQVAWSDLWRNPVTNRSLTTQFNQEGFAISSIAVDPKDATGKTIYAGIAGFPSGQDGIVYSSTDGGAHWLNLTNSLPYAPVNKVLVDPNNSSYIYVAGDFGVYYTSNIANCAVSTQNCWSQLAAGLPNAPVTDLAVFSASGSTVLEAATYGRGIWTLGLTTSPVVTQATLTPASYSFPAQAVGSQSSSVAGFTLKNTGSVTLAILQIGVAPQPPSGDYAQTNTCGASLASGASCTIHVTFTPSAVGSRPGTLTVQSNAQTPVLTASLTGTGLAPGAIALSPTSLSFSTTATGSSSVTQSITVSNTGGAPVTLGAQSITGTNSGDFVLAAGGTCGSTLAAGASCAIPLQFRPTQPGARSAQLQLVASAAGSPFVASLSGTGASPAALVLSPVSLAFATTPVGSTSALQTLTAANTGGIAAQLGTPSVSGDYTLSNNTCGSTLGPGASCSVGIAFAPTAIGNRAGLFTLPSGSIAAGQVTAALTGNGAAPASFSLAPSSLGFGSQQVGTTSAAQTISITNSGGSAAQSPSASTTGDFAISANSCPASLAAGANCSVSVTFAPSSPGVRSGSFVFSSGSSTATASLSGTGTAPPALSANPASLSFPATAESTSSAAQSVTVTNTGSNAAQIAGVAVSGPFAVVSSTCPSSPQSLAAGATCALQLDFTPAATGAASGTLSLSGNFTALQVPLSGTGAAPAAATLSPTSITFPVTAQGAASAAQTFTLTSTGGVALTLGSASVTSEFQISGNNCPASLAPGNSCSIAVLFHPAGTGTRSGTFTQPGNMASGQITGALSGTGAAPGVIAVAPASLQFGSLVVGQTSSPLTVSVSNSGGTPVALGTPALSGDYTFTGNSCGATLAVGQSCSVSIAFHPIAAGDRPGQLTIPGDGSAAAAVATLDGTATTPGQLVASPTSLAFGSVATGSSASGSTTVTNTGGTLVHLSSIVVNGDYAVTGGTCSTATPLAPAAGCTVTVTFTPTQNGTRSGTLSLGNDGSPSVLQVNLAGDGAAPGSLTLSPATAAFGSVILGTAAQTQTFTATNPGGVPVSLGTPVVAGTGFTLAASQCGATLAAAESCSLQVQFSPPSAGSVTGSLSFPGSFSGSPATAILTGSGVIPGALTLSPSPVTFGSAVLQSTINGTVTVLNSGGAPVTLGQPSVSNGFSEQGSCPGTLAAGASCAIHVFFTPTSAGLESGLLTVPMSADGNAATSATDALEGTGVEPGSLAVSPGSLNYPATVLGSSSSAQPVTFRNPGGVSIAIAAPSTSSADYTITANGCGAVLAPGADCTVQVAFTPATAGDRPGSITLAASAANGLSAQALLDGSGEAPAALTFSPPSLNFPAQPVRTSSPPQTITLSNSGDVSTTLALPVLSGPFALSANTCGSSLAARAACQLGVQFIPLADGSSGGTLSVSGGTGSPHALASLVGTGVALAVSPTSISFPTPLLVGSSSAPIAIGVENLGNAAIQLSAPVVTGDFAITSSSCGTTLAADASCTALVAFTPSVGGQRTGTFTIGDGNESATAQLTGTGLSPATDTLAPGALSFGATVVGQVSPAQVLTLINSGDATLTQIAVQTSGPFQAANNCGASLGGHLSCTIAVVFAPIAVGSTTGTVSVADAQRVQTVVLAGQGAAPPQAFASPASLNFGSFAQGVATSPQPVTISNQGKTPITGLSLATSTADFSIGIGTCTSTLAPGASCTVGLVFTPQAIGNRQDTLTVTSPSLTEPLVVSLSGAGEDYQLAVAGSASSVLTSGQTASYRFAVNPVGNSSGSLTIACSGAPANALCTVNPANLSLAPGVAGFVTVSVATAVTASATFPVTHKTGWWAAGSALALLFPLLFPSARRRSLLLALALLVVCSGPVACGIHASGVNSSKGTTPPGQTPSGNYSIVVTASFPGAQRTAVVQLVVQ